VRALELAAVLEIPQHGLELPSRVCLQESKAFLRERAVEDLHGFPCGVGHLQSEAAAILPIPDTPDVAGGLDAIERRGHRTARESRRIGEGAGRERSHSRQHTEAAQVRSIQPQPPRHGFVHFVGGVLKCLHALADLGDQLDFQIIRLSNHINF
jgi:hypothetical protein